MLHETISVRGEQRMPTLVNEKPLIRVSYDEMEAYISLATPGEDEEYTISLLMQALEEKGIASGIDQKALQNMISSGIYGQEVLIAKGTAAVDGIDGYYEYHFNTKLDTKPKVLPNGSVDYWSVRSIEEVTEGKVVATYHPAIAGTDGINVKGKPLLAKRGREQMPLKGKGFVRSEDNLTYTAALDGKIELQNGRIVILAVHEVKGNAELAMGNIDFRGDVLIHGGVESGVSIKATGSITVDGVVEACKLEAGKAIILRSGMLGGNKASVKTKGDITAKFFEFTDIECQGTIQADVLMDCKVNCHGKIMLNGPRGSIIGGEVRAIKGVEVTSLGNNAEKKTTVAVGAGLEIYSRLHILEKKIEVNKTNLERIESGLTQFSVLEKERGVSFANDPRRMALLREKIRDSAVLASDEAEVKNMQLLTEAARGACVTVHKEVFPGVRVDIDEMRFTVKNIGSAVEFYKMTDKIATRPC